MKHTKFLVLCLCMALANQLQASDKPKLNFPSFVLKTSSTLPTNANFPAASSRAAVNLSAFQYCMPAKAAPVCAKPGCIIPNCKPITPIAD